MNGRVSPDARPILLSRALDQPFVHPLSGQAFSEYEPGAVTCTSCHSPHRGMRTGGSGPAPSGRSVRSPKDPARFEYELCQTCHGNSGISTQNLLDISRLFNPGNRSYHPVEAPPFETSPSVVSALKGRQINCGDCHGNADPAGPRGPHGSTVPFILRENYNTVDGGGESPTAYALCYSCHEREAVLSSSPFPEHRRHIVEIQASCSTCHNAHGSVNNRALIRFGEETLLAGVSPSARSGRQGFVSDGPGSGVCYLTCHGYDHGPEAYGAMEALVQPESDLIPLGSKTPPRIGSETLSEIRSPRKPAPDRRKPRKRKP
jgi:cytochrome c553